MHIFVATYCTIEKNESDTSKQTTSHPR